MDDPVTFAQTYKQHVSKYGSAVDTTVNQLVKRLQTELKDATTSKVSARVRASPPVIVNLRARPNEFWYHILKFETEPAGMNEIQGVGGVVVTCRIYTTTDGDRDFPGLQTWVELTVDTPV
jgi:hypothetical protein